MSESSEPLLLHQQPPSPSHVQIPISPNPHPRCQRSLHRSLAAPSMAPIDELLGQHYRPHPPPPPSRHSLGILLLTVYLSFGITVYSLNRSHFASAVTHPVVDAFYFCIVTMCTIGYGDITPTSPFAKLFSVFFVLAGFGCLSVLLSMVNQLSDSLEAKFFKRDASDVRRDTDHRIKVRVALFTVVLCVGIGAVVLRIVEHLGWVDAIYVTVLSVTTVGYGDQAFKTLPGRVFASVWLLVSTLAFVRAVIIVAEARIEKRNWMRAKYALHRDLTVSEFLAADIDNKGFISKSEFVLYKLKAMKKISPEDIREICDLFEKLDRESDGKITISDLSFGF